MAVSSGHLSSIVRISSALEMASAMAHSAPGRVCFRSRLVFVLSGSLRQRELRVSAADPFESSSGNGENIITSGGTYFASESRKNAARECERLEWRIAIANSCFSIPVAWSILAGPVVVGIPLIVTAVTTDLNSDMFNRTEAPSPRFMTEVVAVWEDANYCWVVLCKNHWFHMRQSFLVRHRIPLAETDTVTPLPPLPKHFKVRCDECRKTYTYKPKDVLRSELEVPASFKPHPLFREEPEVVDSDRSKEKEPPQKEPTSAKQLEGEARQEEPSPKESPQERKRAEGA